MGRCVGGAGGACGVPGQGSGCMDEGLSWLLPLQIMRASLFISGLAGWGDVKGGACFTPRRHAGDARDPSLWGVRNR